MNMDFDDLIDEKSIVAISGLSKTFVLSEIGNSCKKENPSEHTITKDHAKMIADKAVHVHGRTKVS